MSDTEKIIEISLAKIENSKVRKGTGKLHKSLLVNSLLNRVRGTETEKTHNTSEPLMNYRESKLMVELDVDDYDMVPSLKERTIYQQRCTQPPSTRKQSSLISKLNTRSLGKTDILQRTIVSSDDSSETKENFQHKETLPCECLKLSLCCSTCVGSPKRSKKRLHSIETPEDDCPRKRLRCLRTPNINTKNQDTAFSVTTLSSLFGNLVAHSDTEKSLALRNKFVSAMVAC